MDAFSRRHSSSFSKEKNITVNGNVEDSHMIMFSLSIYLQFSTNDVQLVGKFSFSEKDKLDNHDIKSKPLNNAKGCEPKKNM